MAGRCRIKVSHGDATPYWMFVDNQECPRIVDVQHKIQERLELECISSLDLDGCVLPSYETTELLRDNDVVHVRVSGHGMKPALNVRTSSPKTFKRKHSDVESEETESGNCAEQEGRVQNIFIGSENERKRKKHKRDKDRSHRDDITTQDPLLNPVSVSHEGDHQNSKEKKKKQRERNSEEKNSEIPENVAPARPEDPEAVLSVDQTESTIGNKLEKSAIGNKLETVDASLAVTNSSIAECDTDSLPKKKRRRRHKKKLKADSPVPTDTCQTQSPFVLDKVAVKLQLPKWKQPKSKKTIFSSEEEENDTAMRVDRTDDETNSASVQDTQELSHKAGVAGHTHSSSLNETAPLASTTDGSQLPLTQNEADSDDAKTQSLLTSTKTDVRKYNSVKERRVAPAVNSFPKVNGVSGANGKLTNSTDSSLVHQQYQNRPREQQNLTSTVVPQVNRYVTPAEHFARDHHQSNIAEHLKMSPEDRGVQVPSYMTAKRLSNGAMLYSRNSVMSSFQNNCATQLQRSSAQNHAKPTYHELSKQQQLNTVNTNRSIIIQNPPRMKSHDNHDARNASNSCSGGDREEEGQETIVLTPIHREYSLFPDLTAAPKEGDRIAYKVLEMGEDYTPGISDFKEAEVIAYDAGSQCATVKVLQINAAAGKKKVPGKFDIEEEEEENDEEDVVVIELSSMFEPKLISC